MPEIVAYKRLAKLPRVVLEGDMLRQIKDWFDENHFSPLVPPIFNRFVIEYKEYAKAYVPESDVPQFLDYGFYRPAGEDLSDYGEMPIPPEREKLEPHEWLLLSMRAEVLVDYDPSLTKLDATLFENGRRSYAIQGDYADLDTESGIWHTCTEFEADTEEEAMTKALEDQDHVKELIRDIIAVQCYVLYHRSEEIAEPKIIKVDTSKPKKAGVRKRGKPKEGTVTLKHKTRRTIVIRESDELPRKAYNYHTLAWNVRGHYAKRGADKHLVYIAPYICRRGDKKKKPRKTTYKITEGDRH